ncbi:MAG: hypothetical protein Q4E89_03220 [Eubacteriales bacterium]|nr:hypothetical protein [Eubacteriales bacterium]
MAKIIFFSIETAIFFKYNEEKGVRRLQRQEAWKRDFVSFEKGEILWNE